MLGAILENGGIKSSWLRFFYKYKSLGIASFVSLVFSNLLIVDNLSRTPCIHLHKLKLDL